MTRYDSMNSINAIYSQIGHKSGHGHHGGAAAVSQHRSNNNNNRTKIKTINPYTTVDRLSSYGTNEVGIGVHNHIGNGAKSNSSSLSANQQDTFSGHINNHGNTFQHFDVFD